MAQRLAFLAFLSVLLFAMLGGCVSIAPAGPLRAQSTAGEPVMLLVDESEAIYESTSRPESSFIVSSVPIDDLVNGKVTNGQFIHIEMLWKPIGGATPLSPTATNISIRHVVFTDGEAGVYAGAGFALPDGEIGQGEVYLRIESATLRLAESTDGFVDRLGEAELVGGFEAAHAPGTTSAAKFALSQLVTDVLGKSVFVHEDGTHTTLPDDYIAARLQDIELNIGPLLAYIAGD